MNIFKRIVDIAKRIAGNKELVHKIVEVIVLVSHEFGIFNAVFKLHATADKKSPVVFERAVTVDKNHRASFKVNKGIAGSYAEFIVEKAKMTNDKIKVIESNTRNITGANGANKNNMVRIYTIAKA
jgi:hypothetical protein